MLYITIWLIGSRTSYHLSVYETAHLTNARGQAHLLNPTYAPAVSSETDLNSKHGDRLVNMCLQITINSVILQVNRRKISLNALIDTQAIGEFHTSCKTVTHNSGHRSVFRTLAWVWSNSLNPRVTKLRCNNWQLGTNCLCSSEEVIKARCLQMSIWKFSSQYLIVAKNFLSCNTQVSLKFFRSSLLLLTKHNCSKLFMLTAYFGTTHYILLCLQCFDAVGWAAGRASSL